MHGVPGPKEFVRNTVANHDRYIKHLQHNQLALATVIHTHHGYWVKLTFWQRVRWLITGALPPIPPPERGSVDPSHSSVAKTAV